MTRKRRSKHSIDAGSLSDDINRAWGCESDEIVDFTALTDREIVFIHGLFTNPQRLSETIKHLILNLAPKPVREAGEIGGVLAGEFVMGFLSKAAKAKRGRSEHGFFHRVGVGIASWFDDEEPAKQIDDSTIPVLNEAEVSKEEEPVGEKYEPPSDDFSK